MHKSAYEHGRLFFQNYWSPEFKNILDIGAANLNGSLRDFCPEGANYIGTDLAEAKGVDLVLEDAYAFPFPDAHFDAIVSTSCFEHDQLFWLTFVECSRVLSPNGYLYINAPSSGPYHGYPYDHWRFYPDASIALETWSARMNRPLTCVESFISDQDLRGFNDCVMIFTRDGTNKPRRYLADDAPRAFNIRRSSKGALENPKVAPT